MGGFSLPFFMGAAMAVEQFYFTPNRVIDQNGISDGASIYFYAAGTTTLQTIYSDAARLTPMANPVVVPAGAAVPNIYLNPDLVYRARCVPSGGGDPIFDYDPYSGIAAGSIALPDGETITNYLNTMHMTYAEIATSKIPVSITRITVTDRGNMIMKRVASDPGALWPSSYVKTQDVTGAWWVYDLDAQESCAAHWTIVREPWGTFDGPNEAAKLQAWIRFLADVHHPLGANMQCEARFDGPLDFKPTSGEWKTLNLRGVMRLRGGSYVTDRYSIEIDDTPNYF